MHFWCHTKRMKAWYLFCLTIYLCIFHCHCNVCVLRWSVGLCLSHFYHWFCLRGKNSVSEKCPEPLPVLFVQIEANWWPAAASSVFPTVWQKTLWKVAQGSCIFVVQDTELLKETSVLCMFLCILLSLPNADSKVLCLAMLLLIFCLGMLWCKTCVTSALMF